MKPKITEQRYFTLFPSCIPVEGYTSSILMDLDKSAYLEIPNLLYEILLIKKESIDTIKEKYQHKLDEGIDGYFDYLAENEYGFFTGNPSPFKEPKKVFFSPFKIISSVIARDGNSDYDLADVLRQLDSLSCQIIQVRVYGKYSLERLSQAFQTIKTSSIRLLELILPYDSTLETSGFVEFMLEHQRVKLTIYNAPVNQSVTIDDCSNRAIIYGKKSISKKSKELYAKKLFTISYNMYYEALFYNTGLYRKVCINESGDIMNYLSHDRVYGNINVDKLNDIIEKPEFQEKYHITNDKIEKCKDCQYRYMCLSNSDLEHSGSIIKKRNTCNFNPYTGVWN